MESITESVFMSWRQRDILLYRTFTRGGRPLSIIKFEYSERKFLLRHLQLLLWVTFMLYENYEVLFSVMCHCGAYPFHVMNDIAVVHVY